MEDIKLVLIGQIFDSEGDYAYFRNATANDEWLRGVNNIDPRSVRNNIALKQQEIPTFWMWHNDLGWYYGISSLAPCDGRGGHAMVILFFGNKTPKNGTLLANKLKVLLDIFITKKNKEDIPENSIDPILNELKEELIETPKTNSFEGSKIGYATYDTDEDLTKRLTYTLQDEYSELLQLYIIPRDNFDYVKEGASLTHVSDKTTVYYKVNNPDTNHISSNKEIVKEGEELIITYKKDKDGSCEIKEIVNKGSSYYDLEDLTLNLKKLSEIENKLKFKKKIYFKVLSSETKINSFVVSTDKQKHYLSYNDSLRFDNTDCKLTISAEGYESKEITLKVKDKYDGDSETIKLKPKNIRIRLKIKDKEQLYEGHVEVNRDSNLYTPLNEIKDSEPLEIHQKSKVNIPILLVLSILMLVTGGVAGFYCGKEYGKNKTKEEYNDIITNLDQDDKEYIKNNQTWSLNKIHLPQNQEDFKNLLAGNYKSIAFYTQNEFFQGTIIHLLDSLNDIQRNEIRKVFQPFNEEKEIDIDTLKKSIEKHIENMLITKDLDYLKNQDVWKKSELKSETYKEKFMLGISSGNIDVNKHGEINNEKWKKIIGKLKQENTYIMKQKYDNEEEKIELEVLLRALKPVSAHNKGNSGDLGDSGDSGDLGNSGDSGNVVYE